MHVATLLFGVSAVFGKLIVSSAAVLVCGRALFAVCSIGLWCMSRRDAPWRGLRLRGLVGLVLTGLVLTIHYITFFIGIKLGGVAVGTLGFACFPAFVTLFEALVFRERPHPREYALVGLVTLGLLLIVPSFSLGDTATIGLLWGIVSGVACAVMAVANRAVAARVSGVHACWWQNVVIVACLLPFTAEGLLAAPAEDWLWIACLGLICTSLAYTLYISSLTILKARLAALIITLEPIYAILAAWLILHDVPGARTVLGGLIITGSVIWAGRR